MSTNQPPPCKWGHRCVKLKHMIFRQKQPVMTLSRWLLVLAVLVTLLLVVSGPGTRLGFWDFRFGFQLIRWAFFGALAVAGLAVVLLVIKRFRPAHGGSLVGALVLALACAWVPYSLYQQATSVPRIHDITTDTDSVPEFVAITPLRADASNPVAYPGAEVAEQQRAAYPEIQPLASDQPAAVVFSEAATLADELGWTVVAQAPEQGRIEAFDTTFWFGFIDDVVIRITGSADQTVVDVRSKSRVGLSDVGKNAARIEAFLDALDERLND